MEKKLGKQREQEELDKLGAGSQEESQFGAKEQRVKQKDGRGSGYESLCGAWNCGELNTCSSIQIQLY